MSPADAKISPLLALDVAGAVLTAVPLICSLADPFVGLVERPHVDPA